MSGIEFSKEEILKLLKFAKFLGLGFYRVTKNGQFVECDPKAREIFGIPQYGNNLSKHSITKLYAAPAERGLRIETLIHNKTEPLCGTLYLRIKGENKLLLDICRYDESQTDEGNFVGFVSGIEESTIFPKMFNTFPLGLYEVDEEDRIVRANNKLVEILKYKNKRQILAKFFNDLCEDNEKLDRFNKVIKEQGFAHDILRLRDATNKIIEVECFSQLINEFGQARWGMINDVTERERSVRAVDRMPTGFYHIEHPENDQTHEREELTQCNRRFAEILGFADKQEALGKNIVELFHRDRDVRENFFKALYEADKNDEPLLNHLFKTQKINGEIIYLSIDVHLVKDSNGNVIGREGTIRDITGEIILKEEIQETEKRLKQTKGDINNLIHTFLHPVVKFAGNSELMYQVSSILYKTIQPQTSPVPDSKEDVRKLGENLQQKLFEIKDNLPGMTDKISFAEKRNHVLSNEDRDILTVVNLKEKLTQIINSFDYNLQTENSDILLERSICDTALWVLEELNKIGYFQQDKLKPLIKKEFIEYLQAILFNFLDQSAKLLANETEIMKRQVEALRAYIGLKNEEKHTFAKHDLGKILEENIDRFKAVLLEESIQIDYKSSGNLVTKISKTDVDRVICNLFYNAKKYSYGGKNRFIKIRAREVQPDNIAEFYIESFGIPIKQKEIDSGKIWEFGYRGELAYASDRDGTGVGLADAKDVIDAHKGKIKISSLPVGNDGNPPQYKVPYRTKVTIHLPRAGKRKEQK